MVIYLPGQNVDEEPLLDELTPREIVRELDKHVVGQADAKRAVAIALRNRIRRQKLAARNGRRGDAEEHPHDRPHGRGQDRTGAAPGAARQLAVPESGSQQVHRGGLCGPRRGIDDPRPGGYLDRHGAGRAAGRSGRPRRSQRRGAPAGSADAAAAGAQRKRRAHAREAARAAARGQARRAHGGDRRQGSRAHVRDHHQRRHRGDGHQPQGHAAQPLRPEDAQAARCAWPRRWITWCRKKSRS